MDARSFRHGCRATRRVGPSGERPQRSGHRGERRRAWMPAVLAREGGTTHDTHQVAAWMPHAAVHGCRPRVSQDGGDAQGGVARGGPAMPRTRTATRGGTIQPCTGHGRERTREEKREERTTKHRRKSMKHTPRETRAFTHRPKKTVL